MEFSTIKAFSDEIQYNILVSILKNGSHYKKALT